MRAVKDSLATPCIARGSLVMNKDLEGARSGNHASYLPLEASRDNQFEHPGRPREVVDT
jgi:hypothetical protein